MNKLFWFVGTVFSVDFPLTSRTHCSLNLLCILPSRFSYTEHFVSACFKMISVKSWGQTCLVRACRQTCLTQACMSGGFPTKKFYDPNTKFMNKGLCVCARAFLDMGKDRAFVGAIVIPVTRDQRNLYVRRPISLSLRLYLQSLFCAWDLVPSFLDSI